AVIHIGANSAQSLTVDINQMDSTTLGGGTNTGTATTADAVSSQTTGTSGNIAITDPSTFTGETGTWTLATTDGTAFTLDKGDGTGAQTIDLSTGTATVDGIELDISGITAAANDEWSIEVTAASTGTGTGGTTIGSLKVADVDSATEASGGVLSQAGADAAIENIQKAIEQVSAERSKLGAFQNRLDHTINNLNTSSENLSAAESRIRDVDMAKEVMEMTKNNILSQASQSMLAQANQAPQAVLQLLG
ncbi:flagellin, partial [Halalkalibacter okhensis]